MPPAAGSVMSSPVAHPPTKTSSSSSGCSSLTAASSRGRFGSFMEVSQPLDQFLLRELSFSGATFTKRIDEREHLVENRIAQGSGRSSLIQRLEADTAVLTFRKRPNGR